MSRKQKDMGPVELWFRYLPDYKYVQEVERINPASREYLHKHPGTRFMRRGSVIATVCALLFFVFCVLINMG